MVERRKLFKSAGTVSAFTLLSRILGFIRDVIIAKYFGITAAAQAFVVAFRIPNTLRHLVGEGAANAAVIPVLSEYLGARNKKEFWHIVNVLLNILLIILALITMAGILLSPVIVRLIAFGFTDNWEKLDLTIRLTKIMFSFIFFIGLAAYAMGVLNTLKHFAAPAAASCFLNIAMIAGGLWCGRIFDEPIVGLAYAVLIGGFLQLAVQVPVLLKKGFKFEFTLDFSHPAIKKMGLLLVPRMIGSSIYQLNVFVDTLFASFGDIVGEGAVAALYYANRLVQFPTALFGNAMATACLPQMAEFAANNETEKLKNTLVLSLKTLLVFLIPSTVGLYVLAPTIIEVLFQRGQFDEASTAMTAFALMYYCIGVFAYSAARVTTSCFYALKDTKTPVKITFICLVINAALNFILMYPLQVAGVALATSLSSILNFCLLIVFLQKKIGPMGFKQVIHALAPILFASLIMGLVCYELNAYLYPRMKDYFCLPITIVCAMLSYYIIDGKT